MRGRKCYRECCHEPAHRAPLSAIVDAIARKQWENQNHDPAYVPRHKVSAWWSR